jgi:hypothetical protein
VQTGLILLAVEVRPSEFEDGLVVPPQKKADRELEQVRHNHIGPEFCTKNVLWRQFQQGGRVLPLAVER